MSEGMFEVQVVDRDTGEERWLRVQARNEEDARNQVAALGQLVGKARLIEVLQSQDSQHATQPSHAHDAYSAVRPRKSPAAAAVLNFLFAGAGYIYAGRSWGWAILIPVILISLLSCLAPVQDPGIAMVWLVSSLAIGIALGWHAYEMVKEDATRD